MKNYFKRIPDFKFHFFMYAMCALVLGISVYGCNSKPPSELNKTLKDTIEYVRIDGKEIEVVKDSKGNYYLKQYTYAGVSIYVPVPNNVMYK